MMVKFTLASAFLFLIAFFTLVIASPMETRTTDDIMQSMGKMSTDLNHLAKSVQTIKNGLSVLNAVALHSQFKNVEKNLNQLEQDVSVAKSVANAQAIFSAVHDLAPTVAVIAKRDVFARLSASQYVLKQLIKAEKATAKVAAALIAMGPADLENDATQIKNELEAAFEAAVKAYENY